MRERWLRWAVVGLSGLAYVLRVSGLDVQSLWRDEVDAIRFSSLPLGDLLQSFATPGQNGPLYHLLLGPWLGLAGRGEFVLRFFSSFFGVLAVPSTYRLARRLFPRLPSVGLVAALLVATSPYLIWYSQEGKMYALVVALVLVSSERYLVAIEQGEWHRWLAYVLFTSLAFYVHLVAALIVPAQALSFLILRKPRHRARWTPWLASMAALSVPYLPLLAWQLPLLLERVDTGYRFVPLHQMLSSLLVNYSLGVVHGALWALALFGALLLAAGLLWRRGGSQGPSLAALLCWLLVPVMGFYLVTLLRPLYTARYLIFVLPAYLLLLSAGLVAASRRSRVLGALLLGALLVVNGWGVWLQARTPLKADFRAATSYVRGRLGQDDLVLFQIPYGRHSFDYYYRTQSASLPGRAAYRLWMPRIAGGSAGPYRWADGLYTNAGMSAEEVDLRMAELLTGSRVLWLVATEVPLWDERGLVQAWLEDHALLTGEASFIRVAVYRYALPP